MGSPLPWECENAGRERENPRAVPCSVDSRESKGRERDVPRGVGKLEPR